MPQESLTTFSPGPKAEFPTSTVLGADDSPLLQFSEKSILGAEQPSPLEGTLSASAESLTKSGSFYAVSEPQIPIGMTLRPRIRLAGSGDGTRLKNKTAMGRHSR